MATNNTKSAKRAPATAKTAREAKVSSGKAAKLASAAVAKAAAAEKRAKVAEERLESIRAVAATRSGVHRQFQGFVDFLREQSVVGLAIGLVLGTQVKVVVDQMIASFFNPLIGLLLPGKGGLEDKMFHVTLGGKTADFGWGAFASVLITFIIVAAVVYFVFKGLGLDRLDKKKE
jgi:large conductance mechanosensitive channel